MQPPIWPNIILAAVLGLYVLWDCRRSAAAMALLVYATLHYGSFTLWALLADPSREEIKLAHRHPDAGIRLLGAALVLCLIGLLAWRNRVRLRTWLGRRSLRDPLWPVTGCVTLFSGGFAWKSFTDTVPAASAINVASTLLLILLTGLLTIDWLAQDPKDRDSALRQLLRIAAGLIFAMNVAGLLEVATGNTFAGFRLLDGAFVGRASAFLYNPNVYGLWCVGAALLAGYLYPRSASRVLPVFVLIMAGAGLLLGASRSSLVLYLIIIAVLLAHSARHGYSLRGALQPPAFMLGGLLLSSGLAAFLGWWLPSGPYPLQALSHLADRMLYFPLDAAAYALEGISSMIPGLDSFQAPSESLTRATLEESVEGRFGGDNGYVAALKSSGWPGLAALLGLLLWTGLAALWRVWPRPGLANGYALAAATGCALSGLLLRSFQLFPAWVFVAFGMACVYVAIASQDKTGMVKAAGSSNKNPCGAAPEARS